MRIGILYLVREEGDVVTNLQEIEGAQVGVHGKMKDLGGSKKKKKKKEKKEERRRRKKERER